VKQTSFNRKVNLEVVDVDQGVVHEYFPGANQLM
jgi:hypothetical protein